MKSSIGELHIGDVLPALTLKPINRTTLALFAGASGDHNPMHIDIDFARQAGMSDVFAHGMLSMAYLGRLVTQWVDQRRLRQLNVRFTGITHLGDEISCTGKVIELMEVGVDRCAKVDIQAKNQHGEVKILGTAVIAIQT